MRITGTVRSTHDCSPIAYARVELWHEGPSGGYDDRYRSVIETDKNGRFSYTGPMLLKSSEGRPHVHFLARANGFVTGVVTVEPPSDRPQRIDVLIVLSADPEYGDVAL